jgi:tetratricopeptide (TPR) repeat protein
VTADGAPSGSGRSPAEAAFIVGWALLTGAATAAPDDPFEAATGALLTAVLAGDPEWSPRASYVLGDAHRRRGDLAEAARHLADATASGHPEWAPAAQVALGLLAAAQGRVEDATEAYREAAGSGHPTHAANAWFNLGTLHQQHGDPGAAVAAFRRAVASGHPQFAPKSAVNLGFVLFTQLGDDAGAREAFGYALRSGDAEQSRLAADNLAAMAELGRQRAQGTRFQVGTDATDVSIDHDPSRPQRRWWFPRG